jgi:HD superfamily phosphohydrolase
VGRIIVGAYIERDNDILSCLTSIINEPFDADKLDYIKRDSLTTGLSLSYDVERLLTKIHVHALTQVSPRLPLQNYFSQQKVHKIFDNGANAGVYAVTRA